MLSPFSFKVHFDLFVERPLANHPAYCLTISYRATPSRSGHKCATDEMNTASKYVLHI